MTEGNYMSVSTWLDKVLESGAYSFATESLQEQLPDYSDTAVKRALTRLSAKGKIISIYKSFYLIIPPQYRSMGILPPQLYLDALMKWLQRPYYVSLLNAAAIHGAAHQQPQEYFVMTNFPVLRPTQKKGTKINYISIGKIPQGLIEKRNTDAGYMNISNVALTACDLVQFERRIGGINRAATVLNELAEELKPKSFNPELLHHSHVTALQRLGYLLEYIISNLELADALFHAIEREKLELFRIPLKPALEIKGHSSDNRWKVIVNTKIEIDE